ncbi:hypothetical protein IQ266_17170 [filamentous cyanobacterium LEGE 11480]|uniref:Uncharacterized protein n=1 Tax=Romeriopsis navalis LEGE 11480 TaxID=2777977 RepID=A0A928VMR8_9CYAN|nr:hypothetical protein [Romeriopsis navalis]MBE9031468.1 hypothetical protein [Romeriopsis navalis LEGE 11480]
MNQDNEIFAFRDAGPDRGYDILTNELGEQDTNNLLSARLRIEQQGGLADTLNDPTLDKQIAAMGDCATVGAHAAYVAHYALDGYNGNTIKTPRFTVSCDDQGNLTMTENPKHLQTNAAGKKVIVKPAMTPGSAGEPATTDVVNNPTGKVTLKTENGRVTIFNLSNKDQTNFEQMFKTAKQKLLGRDAGTKISVPKPQLARD